MTGMHDGSGSSRAQASMEYLASYGWAIIAIAAIAGILFGLGLFGSSSTSTPNNCNPQPYYSCVNPTYTANGISVTVGQDTGKYYYNAWGFISSSSEHTTSSGLPMNFTESNTINMVHLGLMGSGQTVTFDYHNTTAGDIPAGNVPIGNQFYGYVWLAYCVERGCTAPTAFTQIGTLSVKAT